MEYFLPPFPVNGLPERLKHFVLNAAETLNCPVDFMGTFCITVLSTAIGTSRSIKVKQDWIEPPVLYTAVIASPASKKSPAFKLALGPLRKKQSELSYRYKIDLAKYEVELEAWENGSKTARGPKPPKPVMARNLVNDFTFEALAKILDVNKNGVLLGLDELASWIKSMDQYRKGKGGDKEKWLGLWTSSEIIVDRASFDEPLFIERPFVSVTGGIQPGRLDLLQGNDQSGFFERILMSFPEPVQDCWVETGISENVKKQYENLYEELFNLEGGKCEETGDPVPIVLDFTQKAKEGYINFYNQNLSDIKTEVDPFLQSTFRKIEAYVARLALILQVCETPQSVWVDIEAVEVAVVLGEYFKAHARKVVAHLKGGKVNAKILRAVEALKSHGKPMTLRECYTKKIASVKDAKSAKALFDNLEKLGHGKIESIKNPSGGKPTIQFTLRKTHS